MFARLKSWLGRRPRHRGKLVLVIVALLVAAGLLGVQAWAYGQFKAAEQALRKNHFTEAAEHLRRCRTVWWYREVVWLQSARAARRMEDFPEAERCLRKLQQMQGGRPSDEVHLEWSLLRAQQGETDQVVPYLRSLVEADHPSATLILEAVARGFLRKQRFHDAAFLVRLWLERSPDDTVALYCRGFIREQLIGGSRDQAVDDYRRVLELDGAQDEARLRLVQLLVELARPAEARDLLEPLRQRKPNNLTVRLALAACQFATGERAGAEETLDAILAEYPNNDTALVLRGRLALEAERYEQAEALLRKALRYRPSNYQAHVYLCQVLREAGNDRAAAEIEAHMDRIARDVRRLREIFVHELYRTPKHPQLYYEVGAIFLRAGEVGDGLRWLNDALLIDPQNVDVHRELGRFYLQAGDRTKAAFHLGRAGDPVPAPKPTSDER